MGLRRPLSFTVVFLGVLVVSIVVFDDSKADVTPPRRGPVPTVVVPDTSAIGILAGPSPLELVALPEDDRPVLTPADVDDTVASDVTDPFVVRHDGEWLMFLAVRSEITRREAIALARSGDGRSWSYEGLVLSAPGSLSYPRVFEHDGQWFMTTESAATAQVPLFRATDFPTTWEPAAILLEGRRFTDPTPFEHDGRWWMFVSRRPADNDIVELFGAEDPRGPWTAHPTGAIVDGDPNVARPGGPVIDVDGALYRLAQDADPTFGNGVWAFEVLELTATTYRERQVGDDQVLGVDSTEWADLGIGHLHAVETSPGSWTGYVSGRTRGVSR